MSEGLNFCIISDFFVEDGVLGGAALNDEEIYKSLSKAHKVLKIKSSTLTLEEIKNLQSKKYKLIISNFFHLDELVKEYIRENCHYVLYVHDYKFVSHTNPAIYDDFLVPKEELINVDFHLNAAKIICQSSFQKDIYDKNLNSSEITYNFSGNLWDDESFEIMIKMITAPKNNKVAVVKSPYPQKGVPEAIKMCISKNFDYDLIYDDSFHSFLNKLGSFSALAFIPFTPETLSRVVLESKMINVEVYTTNLVGATYEPWWNLRNEELINLMINKREEISKIIVEAFEDEK